MMLVDTSVWIDHLHATDGPLVRALEADEVGAHPLVIEELALGSLASRAHVLASLECLFAFPLLTHAELMRFVERHRLWGRGLSTTDAHLLGAVALVPGATLRTRDRRLSAAAIEVGVALAE